MYNIAKMSCIIKQNADTITQNFFDVSVVKYALCRL